MNLRNPFGNLILTAIMVVTGAATAVADPVNIQTPTGLNPGDHFRIAFVTDASTIATSSNISTYDSFVTNHADGAKYNGSLITWQAIASTPSVNAINHIGVTNDPIYLVDGTKVSPSDSTSGLWSGHLLHSINEDIHGSNPVIGFGAVWTGTYVYGYPLSGYELGGSLITAFEGFLSATNYGWVTGGGENHLNDHQVYGISNDLVVSQAVPEPSTLLLAGLGGIAMAIRAYRRLKNVLTIV